MTTSGDYQLFEAGDVTLQSGAVFPSMRLAYKTYGRLNAGKDNVIVYPTSFSAQHFDTEWLIQPGGILDPDRYFIVIPNLFGNGLSSSPSNSDVTPFPDISYHDAVAVQRRLLVEQFGISKIALVYGWSMGGMQAYHWAACHPDMVERAAVVCGSAQMFALQSRVPRRREGRADRRTPPSGTAVSSPNPTPACAPWGASMPDGRCRTPSTATRSGARPGFNSLEDYLVRAWDVSLRTARRQ